MSTKARGRLFCYGVGLLLVGALFGYGLLKGDILLNGDMISDTKDRTRMWWWLMTPGSTIIGLLFFIFHVKTPRSILWPSPLSFCSCLLFWWLFVSNCLYAGFLIREYSRNKKLVRQRHGMNDI